MEIEPLTKKRSISFWAAARCLCASESCLWCLNFCTSTKYRSALGQGKTWACKPVDSSSQSYMADIYFQHLVRFPVPIGYDWLTWACKFKLSSNIFSTISCSHPVANFQVCSFTLPFMKHSWSSLSSSVEYLDIAVNFGVQADIAIEKDSVTLLGSHQPRHRPVTGLTKTNPNVCTNQHLSPISFGWLK